MRNGATRQKVLEGFLNSLEMKNLCNRMGVLPGTFYSSRFVDVHYQTTAFVANLYREGLERTAAEDELEVWTRALVEGKSASWVAAAFLDGAEFRQREVSDDIFVTILFRTLLKREPGPSEIVFRVGQLAEGMTRGQEVAEICCSDEFGIICSNMQISR